MIKSLKLNKGDTIAVLSPSWGGTMVFPHIYENGINVLKKLGYNIKEYPTSKKDADFIYKNPDFRANDINNAFADKEVKAIITNIGGDDSVRILKYLDTKLILENPKIFIGYSDITTINTYLNQLGLITFNGPQIMAGFSQFEDMGEDFQKLFLDFFENLENYEYKPFSFYSNGYLPWGDIKNTGKLNEKIPNNGWIFLQGNGKISGKLFGGCLQVLEFMKGTKYFPNVDFFTNKIFFLEIAEDNGIQFDNIKYALRNYCVSGIFSNISGLLVGRARDYSQEEKEKLNQLILEVLVGEFGLKNLPVITNLDFGHTDPQWILPLGIEAEFDIDNKRFYLKEKCFI